MEGSWLHVLTGMVSVGASLYGSWLITNKKIQASKKDKLEERLQKQGEDIARLKDRTENYKDIEKLVYSQRIDDKAKIEVSENE